MSHKDRGDLQHQAEHARSRRQSPVVGYLAILFAAAFLLLLLAYFQQQRVNSEATDALKQGVSAVETLQNLMDDNQELHAKVEELEEQTARLEAENRDLQTQVRSAQTEAARLEAQAEAYRLFFRIDRLYRAQRFSDAAGLIAQLEGLGQPADLLSGQPLSDEAGETTPLDRYEQIRTQLREWDYLD